MWAYMIMIMFLTINAHVSMRIWHHFHYFVHQKRCSCLYGGHGYDCVYDHDHDYHNHNHDHKPPGEGHVTGGMPHFRSLCRLCRLCRFCRLLQTYLKYTHVTKPSPGGHDDHDHGA